MKKPLSTQQSPANIAAVLHLLDDTPRELDRLCSPLTPQALHAPMRDGERTPTEVMAHLINVEAIDTQAILLALMRDQPLLHDIHAERDYAKWTQFQAFEFGELLAYFALRRQVLLRLLRSLSDSQWSRTIREEGKQRQESVYWRARSLALHEQEHLTDLQLKLNGN